MQHVLPVCQLPHAQNKAYGVKNWPVGLRLVACQPVTTDRLRSHGAPS